MDAKQFVRSVVLESYAASKADPDSFWKLSGALEAMNRVPERIAIERLSYNATASRNQIAATAQQVRQDYAEWQWVQQADDTLKHVRLHVGGRTTASSTGILPDDPTTWVLQIGSTSRNLRDILDQAAGRLNTIPELR